MCNIYSYLSPPRRVCKERQTIFACLIITNIIANSINFLRQNKKAALLNNHVNFHSNKENLKVQHKFRGKGCFQDENEETEG